MDNKLINVYNDLYKLDWLNNKTYYLILMLLLRYLPEYIFLIIIFMVVYFNFYNEMIEIIKKFKDIFNTNSEKQKIN
jgi:hypothetical protein